MSRKTDKKIMQEIITTETGEIISNRTVYVAKDEPPYVKLYIDCVLLIKGLSKGYRNMLLELLRYMTFANDTVQGGQVIALNAYLKRQIANNLGVTIKRIEQGLTEFTKKGILTRVAVGTYQVNANIFGKGDWADIKKIRDIQANIDFKTCDIISHIVREEEESITKHAKKLEETYKVKMTKNNEDTTRND